MCKDLIGLFQIRITIRYKIGISIHSKGTAAAIGSTLDTDIDPEIVIGKGNAQNIECAVKLIAILGKITGTAYILHLRGILESLFFAGQSDLLCRFLFTACKEMLCNARQIGLYLGKCLIVSGRTYQKMIPGKDFLYQFLTLAADLVFFFLVMFVQILDKLIIGNTTDGIRDECRYGEA